MADKSNGAGSGDLASLLTPEQLKQLAALDAADEDIELASHRRFEGGLAVFISTWAAITALLHIYFLVFSPMDPLLFRALHVMTLSVIGFLLVPGWAAAEKKISILDWAGVAAAICVFSYLAVNFQELIWRIRVRPTTWDMIIAIIGVILVLELTRRCSGYSLLILAAVFLGYALLGQYLPGIIGHPGYEFKRFMGYIYSDYGIFSAPIAISSRYIILFIIFASFLQNSGVGRYFVEWAFSVSGGARGGPAKVAIVASALMGTMSGTSAGNVAATGSLTIPLMKKVGYSPTFAAATEAVASSGGQIMPPIMGAGVFIMAEITGIPYQRIMLAGIIPAILYFFSAFFMVDYEAVKLRLLGFPRAALPNFWQTMRRGYLFIPVLILFYFLLSGWSVIMAGFAGIMSSFVISWVHALVHKDWRMGMAFTKTYNSLAHGAKGTIQLMAVCAAAGIVMGVIALTGIGVKFANLLLGIAGASQLLALIFTMCVAILLGMGMPTTAAYAIAASVLAPGLVRMGMTPLVAHMFVFYFACMSAITPPVALAAYTGSGISGSDPMKTSWLSFRLGLAAFIVPYMFYYGPNLILGNMKEPLLMETIVNGSVIVEPVSLLLVTLNTITALIGVYALASAVQGWFFGRAPWLMRLFLFGAALCLIAAEMISDGIGLVVLVLLFFFQRVIRKAPSIPESVAEKTVTGEGT